MPPLKNSRVRVSWIIIIVIFLPGSSAFSKPPYSPHCSSLVPESPATTLVDPTTTNLPSSSFLRFSHGHFTGGDRILGPDPNSTFFLPKSLSFLPRSLLPTLSPSTFHLAGTLTFRGGGLRIRPHPRSRRRSLRFVISHRNPRSFTQRGTVSFDLDGFWSASSGRLCMVGSAFAHSLQGTPLDLSAVFKLNFPNSSSITTSVVSGVVESLDDDVNSLNYFEPLRVLVYSQKDYKFINVSEVADSCSTVGKVDGELLGFEKNGTCGYLKTMSLQKFRLEYGERCLGRYCGPFARGAGGFKPSFLGFNEVECTEEGRLRMYIVFTDRGKFGFSRILDPDKSLVGEGVWDHERKRLCVVACRVWDVNGSLTGETVGDCTIRLSLWFPSVLSIENMSMAKGRIWSTRDKSDAQYFDMVSFGVVENSMQGAPGVKYKYTQMDRVKKHCVRGDDRKKGDRRYPGTKLVGDMRFDMSLTNVEGKSAWGYASPLFVGEKLYNRYLPVRPAYPSSSVETNQSFWNVSYKFGYTFRSTSAYNYEGTEVLAEGTYDAQTGMLCMVGCRHGESSLDCENLIKVQLPSLMFGDGEHLTGTISSLRKKSDPLYFKPLQMSSNYMYQTQAAETIQWMDIEIIMVLLSLTFSCVFIGVQLFHIKKNPHVLPSISITMLAILTLGYMIPLVLNFEALLFRNHNQQNALLQSGGWLHVNEVIVRVITLVAFFLQFYLLQVAWTSRSASKDKKGMWTAERKTLLCCLPLYAIGGLIALLVHLSSYGTQQKRLNFLPTHQHFLQAHRHSLWEDSLSYAGFVLDNFLLPQFIFNIFWNSKEKSLAPSFCIGTTVLRSLPHVYDAYRAHYVPRLNSSYIYARREADFYSSAWDIVIPCEGLILVILIYLQQRFGGASMLPRRIREPGGYEMVPVDTQ